MKGSPVLLPLLLCACPNGCCSHFRWIKFEEKVEEGGERWSKPHVSTLSLHSLFELRTCLQTGTVLLDLDGYSLPQIIGGCRWLPMDVLHVLGIDVNGLLAPGRYTPACSRQELRAISLVR